MSNMTNSEELSAPDGLSTTNTSSMKVSATFGNATNGMQNHEDHDNFNNLSGDLKNSLENGWTSPPRPATYSSSGTCVPASGSSSAVLVPHLSESDSYSPPMPGTVTTESTQQQSAQQYSQQTYGLPFPLICGETLIHKRDITSGIVAVTTYRLFLQTKDIPQTHNVPIGLIEQVECRDIFCLHILCKDARYVRINFQNCDDTFETMKHIQAVTSPPKKLSESFAFTFYEKSNEDDVNEESRAQLGIELPPFPTTKERFDAEIKRMEFDVQGPWRISDENQAYGLCSSYPTHVIVPSTMDKKKVEQVACFRSARRFPAVVWRHKGNGAVICRCSQPEVGWFGWRSNEDEELLNSIIEACAANYGSNLSPENVNTNQANGTASNSSVEAIDSLSVPVTGSPPPIEHVAGAPKLKKMMILDARSYATAFANRARGGGCESDMYYTNCEIQFMNLANIHSIRKSFINVRQLYSLPADQQTNWYSQLDNTKWLQHMSGLMKAAVKAVSCIENEGRPVLVHCSDGWDRTPQIVALAEILLDPYYRSLEGFQVLVEREWLDFGHKFADRCGQGGGTEDTNERCPVFLQWLDCLHQLLLQFKTSFEFNESYLIKLAQHTYSNLFGTFLCNTAKEREIGEVETKTHSIWRYLRAQANFDTFRNNVYTSSDRVLRPACEVKDLRMWDKVYSGYDNPPPLHTEVINPSQESSPAPSVTADCESSERMASCINLDMPKTRSSSCKNLYIPDLEKTQEEPQAEPKRRRSCDSLVVNRSDEVDGICPQQAEKMISSASEDIQDRNQESVEDCNEPEGECGLVMRDFSSDYREGETEDFSENEDTETNSEGKSESTVINFIKSVQSSTDTLLAETGISSESLSSLSNQKSVTEVNTSSSKTESLLEKEINKVNLTKAASFKTDRISDENFLDEIIENTSRREKDSNDLEANINSVNERGKSREPCEVVIYEDKNIKSELCQNEVDTSDAVLGSGQHCEVCAFSRKLVFGESVMINNGSSSSNPESNGNIFSSNNNTVSTINNIYSVNTVTASAIVNSSPVSWSKVSSYNTPMHSRTPSTGIPATPEEFSYQTSTTKNGYQEKWNPAELPAAVTVNVENSKPCNVDGLAPFRDDVQIAVHTQRYFYEGTIERLKRDLQMTRDALVKQVCHTCPHQMVERQDDAASVADSQCSGELHSVGHESHSSESFETIEEKDTRPPLWLPDYAVTKCMGCEANFWLGRRKHHCRSCGKIFCAECSGNAITIPSEQLYSPVRVCQDCYDRLNPKYQAVVSPGQSFRNEYGSLTLKTSHQDVPRLIQTSQSYHRPEYLHQSASSSSSPKANGSIQRRRSEDNFSIHQSQQLQSNHHINTLNDTPNLELPSCNGMKTSKRNPTGDLEPIVNNLVEGVKNVALSGTNGHPQ